MKINRLMEITVILLNKNAVTARELAERFGVSTRTIYRDIEDLSASGIPVYATQGTGGGIRLMENYSVSKAMISDHERESLIFALRQLQVTRFPEVDSVLEKLGTLFKTNASEWIQVDFSPWGSNPNQYDNLNQIKKAIFDAYVVEFDYVSAQNIKSHRVMEPLRLIFKGSAWYVWGYCLEREDYRTFRISRLRNLRLTDTRFDRSRERIVKKPETAGGSAPYIELERPIVTISVRFTGKVLSRLYDDFDDEMVMGDGDGGYIVNITLPLDEWVYGYILSFGPEAEVLGPPAVREAVKARVNMLWNKYFTII